MTLLIVGLVLFLGIHSLGIVAPGARERCMQALGRNGWRGVHSLFSLAGLVLIIVGYGQARLTPVVVYAPPVWMHHVTFLLMLPVFPLLLAAYLPGRIQAAVKHPMLTAVKTWAFAHLLSNGNLADLLLFGGFLAWAVADRISLKRRAANLNISAAPKPWNDVAAVVLGLALYAATLLWLHRLLIGVPLI
ncbi:MAG: NnrU family protein [Pseudomonadota bacterium]